MDPLSEIGEVTMIFGSLHWLQDIGILGMNRRNAEYIMRCNPRSAYPKVDDKLLTKRLAEEYHVPVPPLYHVVEYHGELRRLKEVLERQGSFVVKPARGAGGSGIVLVTDRTSEGLVKQSGEVVSWKDLTYHISDILS
jgi:glutathione synthase/RimK-type ligase-like ATP-grasp enzyme